MKIEVVYALPHEQVLLVVEDINHGLTVEEVLHKSKILERYPEIDLKINKVGIFSKLVSLDCQVDDGDRIEIYRPLTIDPKLARKKRQQKSKP